MAQARSSINTSRPDIRSGEIHLSNGHFNLDGREIKIGDRVEFAQTGVWLPAHVEFDESRNSYVAVLDNGHVVKELNDLRARWPRS